jgi:hypothetical protein
MPDVLLPVLAEDVAGVGDEVGCVVEDVAIWVRISVWVWVLLNDCPRDEADVEFLGEGLVGLEVLRCLRGLDGEDGVFGCPAE